MQTQPNKRADSPESAAPPRESGIGEGVFKEAQALIGEYRSLARDHLKLAAIETRQAGESAVRMVITGVVAGGVAFIAWASLVAALVAWVVESNWLNISMTLLITGLVHIAGLIGLAFVIRKQGRGLLFSAIVRDLDPTLTGDVGDIQRPPSFSDNSAETPKPENPSVQKKHPT